MTLENSYRILGIDFDSDEEERFKAYSALREKLNRKLEKAPTIGLKEKYKQALKQLDEAIESVESSIDADELLILKEVSLESPAVSPNIGKTIPSESESAEGESRSATRRKWLAVLIGIVLLFIIGFVWRQRLEGEKVKVAAAERAELETAREAALVSARLELEPLKNPYVDFSKKMESISRNAEARRSELESAKQVAEREGGEEEKLISRYRLERYTEYYDWLRNYLGKYSVDDKLESAADLMAGNRLVEARELFGAPVPELSVLEKEIEQAGQKMYKLPVSEFLAKREFDLALNSSKTALTRLDFESAIEWIKPYENAEYIGGDAKSELASLYKLKAEDAFVRAQHAVDIGEIQMAQRILDTLKNDPILEKRSKSEIELVAVLNSEYAFEESVVASKTALERNDFKQAREQWMFLVDDPYVGERAKEELARVDGLTEAWRRVQEAKELEAQQAIVESEALRRNLEERERRELDKPPRVLSKADPVYPDLLRRENVSGYVELEWMIGLDGRATDINVLSSSQYEFELPAIEGVKRWRFQPGEKNGVPVAIRVRQKVLFNPK